MITGIHHVSRAVSDMEDSLAFYRDLLGMEVVLDTEMQGEMLEREVGLEGAHLRLVELAGSSGPPYIELLQYYLPEGTPYPADARPADVGASHVAVLVADILKAHEGLTARGVRFTCPPQEVDAGFFRGHKTAYCFDPDNLIVELWETPAPQVP